MDAQPRESKLAQDYSWAEDFEPDALGGQENDRDRVAEVWKRVENAIYQGPDSALPEVIKILESIPEVIALAATREREQIAQDWRSRFDSEEEYPHPQQSEINDMPSGPSDAEGRL